MDVWSLRFSSRHRVDGRSESYRACAYTNLQTSRVDGRTALQLKFEQRRWHSLHAIRRLKLRSSGNVDDSTIWGDYRSPDGVRDLLVSHSQTHQSGVDGEVGVQYACYGDHLWLAIGGLPRIEGGVVRVQWLVDGVVQSGGLWDAAYRGIDVGWVASPPNDLAAITAMRGAQRMTVSVASTPPVRTSFDVSSLFASPLQRDLDKCADPFNASSRSIELGVSARTIANGWIEFALRQRTADGHWLEREFPAVRRLSPQSQSDREGRWLVSSGVNILAAPLDLQPVRNIEGWTKEGVRYFAQGLSTHVFSIGYLDDSAQTEAWVWVGCNDGHLIAAVAGWPVVGSERVDASWRVDDGTTRRWRWNTVALGGMEAIGAMAHAEFIGSLIGGEWLSVTLHGPKAFTAHIPLDGLFSTPVQANLQQCGRYELSATVGQDEALTPTFTPVRDVSGEKANVQYGTTNDLYEGRLTTRVQILSEAAPGFDNHVVLRIECGNGRLWLSVWAWAGGNDLRPVDWSVDGGANHREIWDQWFGKTNTGYWISPRLDWQVIKQLQNGDRLKLATGEDAPTYFTLSDLFETPVQPNLENCGSWHEDTAS